MKYLFIAYLICIYLSIPGFINKAGYKFILGLIPGYNLYLLFKILEIPTSIMIVLLLGLLFLVNKVFVITLIFLPFLLADAFSKKYSMPILGLLLPFIVFPYLAYSNNTSYNYNAMENK